MQIYLLKMLPRVVSAYNTTKQKSTGSRVRFFTNLNAYGMECESHPIESIKKAVPSNQLK